MSTEINSSDVSRDWSVKRETSKTEVGLFASEADFVLICNCINAI